MREEKKAQRRGKRAKTEGAERGNRFFIYCNVEIMPEISRGSSSNFRANRSRVVSLNNFRY